MPELSTVRTGDYEELASFLANFPGQEKHSPHWWLSRLRAWWDLNPAFAGSFSRGWLLRDKSRIVGFFGAIPWKMQLSGKESIAFGGTTWRMLPEFRGMGMALKSRQMDEHKEVLHMSVNTRREIIPLVKLLRYQEIDRGAGADKQSLLVVDFKKVLRGKFGNGAADAIATKIFAPCAAALQSLRTRHLRQSTGLTVKELSRADESFDRLWERTRARFVNTNVRTAATVNWYCFSIEAFRKKLLGCYDGDRLVGYMILLREESPAMRAFECVDLWMDAEADEEKILAALVAKAEQCARENGFDRVVFPHFNQHTAALYARLGLLARPAWKRNEYFKAPPHIAGNITSANSYFVGAQGDFGV